MQSDIFVRGEHEFARTAVDVAEPTPKRITTIHVGPDEGDYCTVTEIYGDTGLMTYLVQRCLFAERLAIWDWELLQVAQRDYGDDQETIQL